jgi:hypothetical protein
MVPVLLQLANKNGIQKQNKNKRNLWCQYLAASAAAPEAVCCTCLTIRASVTYEQHRFSGRNTSPAPMPLKGNLTE